LIYRLVARRVRLGIYLRRAALSQAGLKSDRVIYLEGGDEKTVLACFEEGLRHGGLGAVVAEIARLPMTASRRLQLAAEGSGAIGIALRRWRRQTEATDFGQPTAATNVLRRVKNGAKRSGGGQQMKRSRWTNMFDVTHHSTLPRVRAAMPAVKSAAAAPSIAPFSPASDFMQCAD
jgi:hypothetical protein